MKTTKLLMGTVLVLVSAIGSAQPGSGGGPGFGPGKGPGARWGADWTPGWTLMTPQERDQHREKMRSVATYEECRAVVDEHRRQMEERAKSQRRKLSTPKRDMCAGLKK